MNYTITYDTGDSEQVEGMDVLQDTLLSTNKVIASIDLTPTINYIWQYDFAHIIFAKSLERCYEIALDAQLVSGDVEDYQYRCLGIAMDNKEVYFGTLQ